MHRSIINVTNYKQKIDEKRLCYNTKRKLVKPGVYYWGKLTKVFSNDVDDETEQVEIIFLKKVENSIDPSGIK